MFCLLLAPVPACRFCNRLTKNHPEMITQAIEINPRVAAMSPSKTLAMSARAKTLRRAGHPVIALSAGEPDFDTPPVIAEAGIQAIRDGHTGYTENVGLLALREAICNKFERDNGLSYTPAQVLCSNGAKQSVAQAVMALCRPGDEVLIPAPYWVSYPEMAVYAGAKPVALPTTAEAQYRITPGQLEAALSEQTRLLILCSPSNPTGSVYPPEELEALAEVLRRYPHVYVISDEIYEHVLFDAQHVSLATFPGMMDRTVVVNGFSKAYAMTGWRLGYLAGPQPIVKAAAKIQSQTTSAPSNITQHAGIAALNMDQQPVQDMVSAFRTRRDFMLKALAQIPGLSCPCPEGAFYLFPDVSHYYDTLTPEGKTISGSEDLAMYLLEEHHVALVPGDAFGSPSGLRISYAAAMTDLEEAMLRIQKGLALLQHR